MTISGSGGSAPFRINKNTVSKTDIYSYRRCPYTFHLIETGAIRREDVFSPIERTLLEDGIAFENSLLQEMPVARRRLDDPLLSEDIDFIYDTPTMMHPRLELIGRPDGFDLRAHAPIEIKHRIRIKPMDKLELAFYWLLLEPIRQNKEVQPYGWIDLLGVRRQRVNLTKAHFKKVSLLIEDVRRARREGVPPLPCDCHICSQRDDVRKVIRAGQDVALVSGIGNTRAETLRRLGIRTVSDLADVDPNEVAARTKALGAQTIGKATIAAAQPHARALRDGVPVWLTEDRLVHEDLISLDIEYDSCASSGGLLSYRGAIDVFLIGALFRSAGKEQRLQHLITSSRELGIALRALRDLLASHPQLPIVTWNGESSDLRYIFAAAERFNVYDLIEMIEERHVDLYLFANRVVRLPVYGKGLKKIAGYLGLESDKDIVDGLAALGLYHGFRGARGKRRADMREQLLRYNEQDLMALIAAADYLRTRERPNVTNGSAI